MRTTICPDGHKHGATPTCYRMHKCGCLECREANRQRGERRAKQLAYGRPTSTMVDAGPARAHIEELLQLGMRSEAIAAAANLDPKTIRAIAPPKHVRDDRPGRRRIYAATAQRILTVTPNLRVVPDHHRLDARGARRRLQALGARGWSITALAKIANLSWDQMASVLDHATVAPPTNKAIAKLFDDLWDQDPPRETEAQRKQLTRTRNRAARRGWLPALAWDDIDRDPEPATAPPDDRIVDELAVDLALAGMPVHLTTAERAVVIARWPESALSGHLIASAIGITPRHLTRLRAALKEAA